MILIRLTLRKPEISTGSNGPLGSEENVAFFSPTHSNNETTKHPGIGIGVKCPSILYIIRVPKKAKLGIWLFSTFKTPRINCFKFSHFLSFSLSLRFVYFLFKNVFLLDFSGPPVRICV